MTDDKYNPSTYKYEELVRILSDISRVCLGGISVPFIADVYGLIVTNKLTTMSKIGINYTLTDNLAYKHTPDIIMIKINEDVEVINKNKYNSY